MNSHTTLRLKTSTLKRLTKHGKYGDSMDSIINSVLDIVENNRK